MTDIDTMMAIYRNMRTVDLQLIYAQCNVQLADLLSEHGPDVENRRQEICATRKMVWLILEGM